MTTDQRIEEIHELLAGSLKRQGLVHRVDALEATARTSWARERATKALDALILGTVVLTLLFVVREGVKAGLREMLQESSAFVTAATRRHPIPRPIACPDCKEALRYSSVGDEDDSE